MAWCSKYNTIQYNTIHTYGTVQCNLKFWIYFQHKYNICIFTTLSTSWTWFTPNLKFTLITFFLFYLSDWSQLFNHIRLQDLRYIFMAYASKQTGWQVIRAETTTGISTETHGMLCARFYQIHFASTRFSVWEDQAAVCRSPSSNDHAWKANSLRESGYKSHKPLSLGNHFTKYCIYILYRRMFNMNEIDG